MLQQEHQAASCSVQDCTEALYYKDLCRGHYRRLQRYGIPHGGQPKRKGTLIERLIDRIDFDGPTPPGLDTPCWLWKGSTDPAGYGTFKAGGRAGRFQRAHRLVYEEMCGPIPPGLDLMHRCDNPPCCSPLHTLPGTPQENAQDSVNKGRRARGERHGRAKLTEQQVREIRSRAGQESQRTLALQYGVSAAMISFVQAGKNWSHVK